MSALHRFLYEKADSHVIDGLGLQPDPELAARNLARAKEVIAKMGNRWCLHPDAVSTNQRRFSK
jgi:hypothetical protein